MLVFKRKLQYNDNALILVVEKYLLLWLKNFASQFLFQEQAVL